MDLDLSLTRIASDLFAQHGIEFNSARRAGGWTNANWIASGLVLRLSTAPDRVSLRREAQLAAHLPLEVGYPAVIDSGISLGHEWVMLQELPGRCLGEVWAELSDAERASAFTQLWRKAELVHASPPAAHAFARDGAWFNSTDPVRAAEGLDRLEAQGLFSHVQAQTLRGLLERFWQSLPAAQPVLNHGDLTLANAFWQAGRVTALLDFEFAVRAPTELDWNTLLKSALAPGDHQDTLLRRAALELAAPALAQPAAKERLFGYAVLLELWLLEDWLAHPEGEGPLETWEPYRRLLSLSDGQGGYLSALGSGIISM